MSKQTEQVVNAFLNGQRVKLGCMTGKTFERLVRELREFRQRQQQVVVVA